MREGGSEFQRWIWRKKKVFNNLFERPICVTGFGPPERFGREEELLYLFKVVRMIYWNEAVTYFIMHEKIEADTSDLKCF